MKTVGIWHAGQHESTLHSLYAALGIWRLAWRAYESTRHLTAARHISRLSLFLLGEDLEEMLSILLWFVKWLKKRNTQQHILDLGIQITF